MKLLKRETIIRIGLVLGATAVSVLVAGVVLEFALRIVSPLSLFSPFLPLRPSFTMKLFPKLPGVSPEATFSTNKLGFRGDEPPNHWGKYYTIAAVGGSTTQCMYIDDHKTWPYLLQERLKKDCPASFGAKCPNVWVGNGGLDGHSSRGHLLFMDEVIPKIKPDMVVVLVGANDLGDSVFGDPHYYRSPYERFDPVMWLYVKSRLFQTIHLWYLILVEHVSYVNPYRHSALKIVPMESSPMKLPDDLRELLPTLAEYRANIVKMIRKGKSLNIRMLFLTQPLLFDATPRWEAIEGASYFHWIKTEYRGQISAATFSKLMDIVNQTLIDTCKSEGVPCFDLASVVPHSELYMYDAAHFTELGCQLIADQVAEFMTRN